MWIKTHISPRARVRGATDVTDLGFMYSSTTGIGPQRTTLWLHSGKMTTHRQAGHLHDDGANGERNSAIEPSVEGARTR